MPAFNDVSTTASGPDTTAFRAASSQVSDIRCFRGRCYGDALSMALHLREQEMSLRDIAARLVITTGKKKCQHPSPAAVMRMLREHDEQTTEPLAP